MQTATLEQTDVEQKNDSHNAIYEDMVLRFDLMSGKFRKGEYPTCRDIKYMLLNLKDTWQFLENDSQRNMYRDIRAVLLCYADAKAKNQDKPKDWDFNSGYELLQTIGMPSFEYTPHNRRRERISGRRN